MATASRFTARFRGRCAAKRCAKGRNITPGQRCVHVGPRLSYHDGCQPKTVQVLERHVTHAVESSDDSWDRRRDLA